MNDLHQNVTIAVNLDLTNNRIGKIDTNEADRSLDEYVKRVHAKLDLLQQRMRQATQQVATIDPSRGAQANERALLAEAKAWQLLTRALQANTAARLQNRAAAGVGPGMPAALPGPMPGGVPMLPAPSMPGLPPTLPAPVPPAAPSIPAGGPPALPPPPSTNVIRLPSDGDGPAVPDPTAGGGGLVFGPAYRESLRSDAMWARYERLRAQGRGLLGAGPGPFGSGWLYPQGGWGFNRLPQGSATGLFAGAMALESGLGWDQRALMAGMAYREFGGMAGIRQTLATPIGRTVLGGGVAGALTYGGMKLWEGYHHDRNRFQLERGAGLDWDLARNRLGRQYDEGKRLAEEEKIHRLREIQMQWAEREANLARERRDIQESFAQRREGIYDGPERIGMQNQRNNRYNAELFNLRKSEETLIARRNGSASQSQYNSYTQQLNQVRQQIAATEGRQSALNEQQFIGTLGLYEARDAAQEELNRIRDYRGEFPDAGAHPQRQREYERAKQAVANAERNLSIAGADPRLSTAQYRRRGQEALERQFIEEESSINSALDSERAVQAMEKLAEESEAHKTALDANTKALQDFATAVRELGKRPEATPPVVDRIRDKAAGLGGAAAGAAGNFGSGVADGVVEGLQNWYGVLGQ